jgi:hypothetical protein
VDVSSQGGSASASAVSMNARAVDDDLGPVNGTIQRSFIVDGGVATPKNFEPREPCRLECHSVARDRNRSDVTA